MKNIVSFVAAGALLCVAQSPAFAQTVTPQQIQGQIHAGQEQAALNELQGALQAHPTSGVAWYLRAEAEDAAGNAGAARDALAKAEQYAPGLPFANGSEVAALQNHLNSGQAVAQSGQNAGYAAPVPAGRGVSPIALVIGGVAVLFILFRLFARRRRMMMGGGMNQPMGPVGPYGPQGGMGMGGMGGMGMGGGGMGGSILGGLAAGAGFAAGERVLGDIMGGNRGGNPGNDQINDTPAPGRDDGLQGDPGWGDNSGNIDNGGSIDSGGGGDFDSGNSW